MGWQGSALDARRCLRLDLTNSVFFALAAQMDLTIYDAAYLELARFVSPQARPYLKIMQALPLLLGLVIL